MNAPLGSVKECCFFMPDPWSFDEVAFPKYLNDLLALPRYAARNYLDIDRKQGFTIPTAKWLRPEVIQHWKSECGEQLKAVLSDGAVRRLSGTHRNLAAEHGLFAAMVLTTWMRIYGIST